MSAARGTRTDASAAGPTRPPATGDAATHCAQGRVRRAVACGPAGGASCQQSQKKPRARRKTDAPPARGSPRTASYPSDESAAAPTPRQRRALMGQQTSSHNDAPPPPSIPLTPRCGRAVRQVNDVLERGGWRVFESCDDDFTGVVSIQEIRAKFIEVLRSSTTASSLSQPALDAFLACCDRGDGFVDHGGWNVCVLR